MANWKQKVTDFFGMLFASCVLVVVGFFLLLLAGILFIFSPLLIIINKGKGIEIKWKKDTLSK